MANRFLFGKDSSRRATDGFTDADFVARLLDDRRVQAALYRKWKRYFDDNYRSVFFGVDEERRRLIVHESFVVLWEKVRCRKIYAEGGTLKGSGGKPFAGTLATYLMGVAKLKNKELVREAGAVTLYDDLLPAGGGCRPLDEAAAGLSPDSPFADSADDSLMREIVSEAISEMSPRCSQVLTLFYYEEMRLDSILEAMPSFSSKDALKTHKKKCMDKLKAAAIERYRRRANL